MVRSNNNFAMVLSSEWSQVEVIDLVNDGSGLGFNIVGGRSTGVVIKYIMPGTVADKNGRLQAGDHVLQIGAVNLRGFTSEQVAGVLRQAGGQVRMLVARPVDPTSVDFCTVNPAAPIVPTKYVVDPEALDQHLIDNGYSETYNAIPQCYEEQFEDDGNINGEICPIAAVVDIIGKNPVPIGEQPYSLDATSPFIAVSVPIKIPEMPEMEVLDVQLKKNVYGLGITVAGYVCEKEELSGIFVKSIIDGSSAEGCGQIQINDRIVQVDGISLLDKSNHQAVEILRNTDISVHLVLERYLRGPKFEHLQLALWQQDDPPSPSSESATTLSWFPIKSNVTDSATEIEPEPDSNTTIDSTFLEPVEDEPTLEAIDQHLDKILNANIESIKEKWVPEVGIDRQVIVADVQKLSGLGISIEGTVDVEGGQEIRPHHYIRSILPEGPVGQQGILQAGDELLQVNDCRLHGMKYTEVVDVLKKLPNKVRLVCARNAIDGGPRPVVNLSQDREGFEARKIISGSLHNLTTAIKAQSDGSVNTSSTATLTDKSSKSKKSRSLECVSGLAMWYSHEDIIEINKTEQGLGFSILDYQDPVNPDGTVIVVRSLVPAGSAEKNGQISPGDRVMSVNGIDIRNANLDRAVQALKGAPRGIVKIGIARPLPVNDTSHRSKSFSSSNTVKECS